MDEFFYLTLKELEILPLVAEAKSNAEIAKIQFLSPRTIESHIHNILTKTACINRTQLIVLFFTAKDKFIFKKGKLTKKQMITELWTADETLRTSAAARQANSSFNYASSVIQNLKVPQSPS